MKKRWMKSLVAVFVFTVAFSSMRQTVKATSMDENTISQTDLLQDEIGEEITQEQSAVDEIIPTPNAEEPSDIMQDENDVEDNETGKEDEPEKEPEEEVVVKPIELDQQAWANTYLNYTKLRKAKTVVTQLKLQKKPKKTTAYTVTWRSSSKKIATVDQNGLVTAVNTGKTKIICTVKAESGFKVVYECEIEVTNPKFAKSTYYIAKGVAMDLGVIGTKTKDFTVSSSAIDVLTSYKSRPGYVRTKKTGRATVKAKVDGIYIRCTVVVTDPVLKRKLIVMGVNQKEDIVVTGHNKTSKITYASGSKKVATVSSKGVVKSARVGVSVVKVMVDYKELEVTVAVGKKQAVSAIKYAQRALGSTYSQNYRMRKGYYDCSSLVWRSYRPTGILFGYSKNAKNAPTAAEEARYLVSRGKEIASTYVSDSKLRPGDLIFMSNRYNGRYRNITHVAIYIGNDRIIHATPRNTNDVQYGRYSYYKDMVVCIGRPV